MFMGMSGPVQLPISVNDVPLSNSKGFFKRYFVLKRSQFIDRLKCVLFMPECFYYAVAEYPDLIGPLGISTSFLVILCIMHYWLNANLSIPELSRFAVNMFLGTYCYVLVVPIIVGIYYRIRLQETGRYVFKDCVLLSVCIGYSMMYECLGVLFMILFREMRVLVFLFVVYQSAMFLCKSAGHLSFETYVFPSEECVNAGICWTCLTANVLFNWFMYNQL